MKTYENYGICGRIYYFWNNNKMSSIDVTVYYILAKYILNNMFVMFDKVYYFINYGIMTINIIIKLLLLILFIVGSAKQTKTIQWTWIIYFSTIEYLY